MKYKGHCPYHIYRNIWEEHYGRIPVGNHIHHINGDSWDNRIENLQCVTPEEHYLIHKKQGDTWAANMLLAHLNNKNFDQDYYPVFHDSKLQEMSRPGFIRIPRRAWYVGKRGPGVIFKPNSWFEERAEELELYYTPPVREDIDDLKNAIREVLETLLTSKERSIINATFGIGVDKMSSKAVADKMRITVSNVNKTKFIALKKLKDQEVIDYLKEFYYSD